MRRTGKRAFDPAMGSEGMSQLLMTYSIFMTRGPHKIAREVRREPNGRRPAKGAYFRMKRRSRGACLAAQEKRAPEGARSKQARFRASPCLSLEIQKRRSVVVGLFAVIGEIEPLFL